MIFIECNHRLISPVERETLSHLTTKARETREYWLSLMVEDPCLKV